MANDENNTNLTGNNRLHRAMRNKNDEFYTRLEDIENELKYYKDFFQGKTVFCNCDDPRKSNFFHYFSYNFEHLGLKKLITTCYKSQNHDLFSQNDSEQAIYLEYTGDKNGNKIPDLEEIGIKPLQGDGDFRSEECIELLKQADVVVTNPPFSLFREYIAQLMEYNKKFLIIGAKTAIGAKDIFPLIKENRLWLGYNSKVKTFRVPEDYEGKLLVIENGIKYVKNVGNIGWFTNIETTKRYEDIELYKKYTPEEYPKYDNYDAIEVSEVVNIPQDYDGVMGVPITFLDKYNPNQFEIVHFRKGNNGKDLSINGKELFSRILIKRKR